MSDTINALQMLQQPHGGGQLPAPAIINPLAAYSGAMQTAGQVYDLRAKQAQMAVGQIATQSIDPVTKQFDPTRFNAQIAAAGPAVAMAAQGGLQNASTLADTQTRQQLLKVGWYNGATGALPDNASRDQVINTIRSGASVGMTPTEIQNEIDRVPTDPAQLAGYIQQHRLTAGDAAQQLQVQYGTAGTLSTGSGTYGFTQAHPARGGGLTIGGGVSQALTPDQMAEPMTLTDPRRTLADGSPNPNYGRPQTLTRGQWIGTTSPKDPLMQRLLTPQILPPPGQPDLGTGRLPQPLHGPNAPPPAATTSPPAATAATPSPPAASSPQPAPIPAGGGPGTPPAPVVPPASPIVPPTATTPPQGAFIAPDGTVMMRPGVPVLLPDGKPMVLPRGGQPPAASAPAPNAPAAPNSGALVPFKTGAGPTGVGVQVASTNPLLGPTLGPAAPPSPLVPGDVNAIRAGMNRAQAAPATGTRLAQADWPFAGVGTPGLSEGEQAEVKAAGPRFDQEISRDQDAQNQQTLLGNMLADLHQFTPGTPFLQNLKSLSARYLGVDTKEQAAREDFNKQVNQLLTQQGAGSDMRMGIAEAATPNEKLTPQGADLIIRQLQGNADFIRARAQLARQFPNRTDYETFQGQAGQLDPRAFQVMRMTDDQRKDYLDSLDDKARDQIINSIRFARTSRLVP